MLSGLMGQGGGSQAPPPAAEASKDSNDIVCLNPLINQNSSQCLNEDSENPLAHVFNCSDALVLKSDCDAQLILNIYFDQPVRVHHLKMLPVSDETAPVAISILANRAPLDFDDMESVPAD